MITCKCCKKDLGDVPYQRRYCIPCKKLFRQKTLLKYAPKAREKSKLWREQNPKQNIKIKKECYKKNREYYLNKAKQYSEKRKVINPKYHQEILNKNAYRSILIKHKIPPICRRCGTTENYNSHQLSVHHIDGNHSNNVFSNIVWICESCHQYLHNSKGINSELIKVKPYDM